MSDAVNVARRYQSNHKISLDMAQNMVFFITYLQCGKFQFVVFKNLYNVTDAMRCDEALFLHYGFTGSICIYIEVPRDCGS